MEIGVLVATNQTKGTDVKNKDDQLVQIIR